MLFAALSVGASAANRVPSPYHDVDETGTRPVNMNQAVCFFDLGGGKMKNPVQVYSVGNGTEVWKTVENLTGTWYMIPNNNLPGVDQTMTVGWRVTLPAVVAPAGWQFDGWYCYDTGDTYAANGTYTIRPDDVGSTVSFAAAYSPAPVADDNGGAMGILTKVFGTILGIFIYEGDIEKGIALVTKMLGSIFG